MWISNLMTYITHNLGKKRRKYFVSSSCTFVTWWRNQKHILIQPIVNIWPTLLVDIMNKVRPRMWGQWIPYHGHGSKRYLANLLTIVATNRDIAKCVALGPITMTLFAVLALWMELVVVIVWKFGVRGTKRVHWSSA